MPTKTATKTRTKQRAQPTGATHSVPSPLSQKKNGRRAPRADATQVHVSPPLAFSTPPYQQLRGLYLARIALQQDIQAIENRISGHERRGEHLFAMTLSGFHDLDTMRLWKRNIEAGMKLIVRDLPPYAGFLSNIRGVDILGASVMLACIGDPAQYKNPSTIWKRMGLAVITDVDSEGNLVTERQRRRKDKRLALIHGYDGIRHAVAWIAAKCLCQFNDEYKTMALERQARHKTEGWGAACVAPCQPTVSGKRCRGCSHRWKDARRFAIKRLLRELWIACQ